MGPNPRSLLSTEINCAGRVVRTPNLHSQEKPTWNLQWKVIQEYKYYDRALIYYTYHASTALSSVVWYNDFLNTVLLCSNTEQFLLVRQYKHNFPGTSLYYLAPLLRGRFRSPASPTVCVVCKKLKEKNKTKTSSSISKLAVYARLTTGT